MDDRDLLSASEEAQLREFLERDHPAEVERRLGQKFYTYFPDEGPVRRGLYPKHMEFFAAGAEFPERLFMAANRCITPWTVLQTASGERQCGEMLAVEGFAVQSWDGAGRCMRPASPVFLKGIEPALRLHLDNGMTVDCSAAHEVLTVCGYLSVGHLIQHAGGRHWWRSAPDSPASYATDARPHDGLLLGGADTAAARPPSRADVLARTRSLRWPADVAVPRRAHTRPRRSVVPLSIPDDRSRLADLCAAFPDPSACTHVQSWTDTVQSARQSPPVLTRALSAALGWQPLDGTDSRAVLADERFCGDLLLLSSHTPLVGGARIVVVGLLGLQPILDLTVDGTHNYITSGVVSHNSGKTDAGSFEVTCHLTGLYPDWWEGRRFTAPIEVWACGTTSETTRDIVQAKLLGSHDKPGTGMVPSHLIAESTRRPHGLPGSIESAYIRHVSGGKSLLGLKTYEQGRKSFEGTAKSLVWCDEEPPIDVYQEMLLRTLTTNGIMLVTFTPLQGMSEVVTGFIEPSEDAREVKMYVQAGWDDVPHLTEADKKRVLATMLPYQIAARTKGEPSLGAGAIYPIPEADVVVPSFFIPWTWPRGYGMDVGWNRTAAVFVTRDIGSNIYYVYDMHYLSAGEPPSHAMGIRARGEWLEGAIDPAANGRGQEDGKRLLDSYRGLGLTLLPADHAIETGLLTVWTLLISGQLKFFSTCDPLLREFRKYHRDEKGNIVKTNDHAMDALRYFCMSGREHMKVAPQKKARIDGEPGRGRKTWMAN